MEDERIDLRSLRLSADPSRRQRLKASIRARSRAELLRRAAPPTPAATLARWFTPVLAGSGLLAASLAALAVATHRPDASVPASARQPRGMTPMVEVWLANGAGPDLLDLIVLFDGEDR